MNGPPSDRAQHDETPFRPQGCWQLIPAGPYRQQSASSDVERALNYIRCHRRPRVATGPEYVDYREEDGLHE
ncbi:hypothetical protein [Streptomyces formicae]